MFDAIHLHSFARILFAKFFLIVQIALSHIIRSVNKIDIKWQNGKYPTKQRNRNKSAEQRKYVFGLLLLSSPYTIFYQLKTHCEYLLLLIHFRLLLGFGKMSLCIVFCDFNFAFPFSLLSHAGRIKIPTCIRKTVYHLKCEEKRMVEWVRVSKSDSSQCDFQLKIEHQWGREGV